MTKNYYASQVLEDVMQYLEDNYYPETIIEALENDRYEFETQLNDDLWIDDSVTGNGSGSYTFNREKAKEIVLSNIEDVIEALEEFGQLEDLGRMIKNEDFEALDVTARCYYLPGAIAEALDQYC